METLRVQLVAGDGTYREQGLRVRAGPGNGEGSLHDEFERGVRTPLAGDKGKQMVLSCITDPELKAFVRSLPVARMVRATDLEDASAG